MEKAFRIATIISFIIGFILGLAAAFASSYGLSIVAIPCWIFMGLAGLANFICLLFWIFAVLWNRIDSDE